MIKEILYIGLLAYVIYISILLLYVPFNYTTFSRTIPRRNNDNIVSFISSSAFLRTPFIYPDADKPKGDDYSLSVGKRHNLRNPKNFQNDNLVTQPAQQGKQLTELFPPQVLLWNSSKSMFEENEVECKTEVIKIMRARINICLRKSNDVFSNLVRSKKAFTCPTSLFKLWNEQVILSNGKYMEIGAGIGNCLMQMLYYQIHSIAFEPVPQNLYILTKSVLMNKNMSNYLTLFGNALGGYTRHGFVYSDNENWMDSTMNKNINTTNPIANNMVDIFNLDSIINDSYYKSVGNISVLSVDVNGYEYHVLTGAVKFLNKKFVKSIFCKIDCDKLSSFNVDINKLFSFLEERKFEIENKVSCESGLVYNLIARLKLS